MCRLFGLHAGHPVDAEFWLIDAPDSLAVQSHRNPDGAGVGVFGADGQPEVYKKPIAAWQDTDFARTARHLHGTTFVAHVRYASTGAHTMANTHPFLQDCRLLAHNGVVQGLPELEGRLTELGTAELVHGETDSERVFALITGETRRRGGDLDRGLTAAVGWIADHLPLYAVNLVLVTPADLWALRYPATHELYVLDRPAGGSGASGSGASGRGAGSAGAGGTAAGRALEARSERIKARSPHLQNQPSVVIASERMDDDPAWRLLEPGELLHVGPDLHIDRSTPFPAQPRRLLQTSDLDATAAASQHPA